MRCTVSAFDRTSLFVAVVLWSLAHTLTPAGAHASSSSAPALATVTLAADVPDDGTGVPLRSLPSTSAAIAARIPPGQRVLVHDRRDGDFRSVTVIDFPSARRTGFVHARYLRAVPAGNPFTDVPSGHWAATSIAELAHKGIVQGHDDCFFGQRSFSRYEMAAVVARMIRHLESVVASAVARERGSSEPRRPSDLASPAQTPPPQPAVVTTSGAALAAVRSDLLQVSTTVASLEKRLLSMKRHAPTAEAMRRLDDLERILKGHQSAIETRLERLEARQIERTVATRPNEPAPLARPTTTTLAVTRPLDVEDTVSEAVRDYVRLALNRRRHLDDDARASLVPPAARAY